MIQQFTVGDHARMFTAGLREAFGTAKGLTHLLDQCAIVTKVDGGHISLDMGDYGVVQCSAKNAYQTMPAQGFEDIPDFMNDQSNAAPNVPTLRDELNRKVDNTLEWLISGHKKGVMSDEACSVAADALFMAVSGLCKDDLVQVITAIGSYLPSSVAPKKTRIFSKEQSTLVLSWTLGNCDVSIFVGGTVKFKSFDSTEAAKVGFDQLAESMKRRGFLEQI